MFKHKRTLRNTEGLASEKLFPEWPGLRTIPSRSYCWQNDWRPNLWGRGRSIPRPDQSFQKDIKVLQFHIFTWDSGSNFLLYFTFTFSFRFKNKMHIILRFSYSKYFGYFVITKLKYQVLFYVLKLQKHKCIQACLAYNTHHRKEGEKLWQKPSCS